ncbi:SapB/AmfS family lanthipeptide [Streptomyces sp. enrichment culture]
MALLDLQTMEAPETEALQSAASLLLCESTASVLLCL